MYVKIHYCAKTLLGNIRNGYTEEDLTKDWVYFQKLNWAQGDCTFIGPRLVSDIPGTEQLNNLKYLFRKKYIFYRKVMN